jgi:vacuolar-type H+-ATPase subunit E/Vma4
MDNEKIIKKLESFEKAAINDAARKAAVFIGEDKTENQKFAEKQEFAFLEEAYGRIQQAIKRIEKESEETYSEKLIEVKKILFSKRIEIINAVFDSVEKRLEAYRNSDEYPAALTAFIKSGVEKAGRGRIRVITDEQDIEQAAVILKQLKIKAEIEKSEKPLNGGCIVENPDTGISVDNSYISRLERQKEDFLAYSGMRIDI